MKSFEEELKAALARLEPPAGFSDRVMARLPGARPARRWRGPIAACVAALVCAGGYEYQQMRVERREGEAARQQLIYALGLASEKLTAVQHKVLER